MTRSTEHRAGGGDILRDILPEDVASCERRGKVRDPMIFAEELALVENAVNSRRRHVLTRPATLPR